MLVHEQSYQVICCCKDGFYRVFEFNMDDTSSAEDGDTLSNELKLINKYQINSYVDLIEELVFDEDLNTLNG